MIYRNHRTINLIVLLFAVNCLACFCLSPSTAKAQIDKAKAETDKAKAPIDKEKDHAEVKAKKHINKADQFVPPPPPIQPVFLGGSPGGGQLDFMSKDMVVQRLKDVQKELADAKRVLADKIEQLKDGKDKCQRFEALYKEGVVSRHEWEAVQKEAGEGDAELSRFKANVDSLAGESTALSDKLKAMKKNTSHGHH